MSRLALPIAFALIAILPACSIAGDSGLSAPGARPGLKTATASPQFTLLHSFVEGPDGGAPLSDLRLIDGLPYGTTSVGGTGGRVCSCGTVFYIDGSAQEHVVSRFKGIYSKKLGQIGDDGAHPQGGLMAYNGFLYGTTSTGGLAGTSSNCWAQVDAGCGTVFRIDATGKRTTMYRFRGGGDGKGPVGDLVALRGKFYGVTSAGGPCRCGTIYAIDPSGYEHPIYPFNGKSDTGTPEIGLSLIGKTLYGTAFGTESCGCGAVFTISTEGAFKLVHQFTGGSDGANPESNLVDVNGTLFGTVSKGAGSGCQAFGCGGIYSIDPYGHEQIVWSFGTISGDGAYPSGPLAVVNGKIYGTTQEGGTYGCRFRRGCGTIFAFDPKSDVETPVFRFTSAQGANPLGVTSAKGVLYGMTHEAGGHRVGTAFSFMP